MEFKNIFFIANVINFIVLIQSEYYNCYQYCVLSLPFIDYKLCLTYCKYCIKAPSAFTLWNAC